MIPRFPKGFSHPVQIGIGGFGAVFRAHQSMLDRLVAIKFIVETNAMARAELIKEAGMQAEIHLQGIPQVYDVKEIAGNVCIIMQWIRGCSLREIIEHHAAHGAEQIIAREIVRITASLHKQDYAHRDIKPENIIISTDGIYFIDFGLAHHLVKDPRQTMANIVKGTLEYIAPEFLKGLGSNADLKRADLYSMGKVIQELYGDIPLPDSLAACLERSPNARPASAVEVLQNLNFDSVQSTDWKQLIEPNTSIRLSGQLYRAAQVLLNKRRIEEAYDLFVECLQVNPEYPGVLEIMDRFPLIKKEQNLFTRCRFAVLGVALLFLLSGSIFMYFNRTATQRKNAVQENGNERFLFIDSPRSGLHGIDRTLPFKDQSESLQLIRGNLVLAGHPKTGTLFIDGKRVSTASDTLDVSLRNSTQHLAWHAENGSVVWQEVVTTYPFEIKRIYIRKR